MNDIGDARHLRDFAVSSFDDDDLVTIADPIGRRRFGMNFDERVRPFLPQSSPPTDRKKGDNSGSWR